MPKYLLGLDIRRRYRLRVNTYIYLQAKQGGRKGRVGAYQ